MMSNALTICREYGQGPAWWDTVDGETQGLLLADLEQRNKPPPKAGR
jgi:hypothetical protein